MIAGTGVGAGLVATRGALNIARALQKDPRQSPYVFSKRKGQKFSRPNKRKDFQGYMWEAKLSPQERKARRKRIAKRVAIGAGVVGVGVAAAHYGPKIHRAYGQRKIRNRVYDNIARSQRARRSHGVSPPSTIWDHPIFHEYEKSEFWDTAAKKSEAADLKRRRERAATWRKVGQWSHDTMISLDGLAGQEKAKKTGKLNPSAKSLVRHVGKKPPETYTRKGVEGARGEYPIFVDSVTKRKKRFLRKDKIRTHRFIHGQGTVN
jgi:hypothetical protein